MCFNLLYILLTTVLINIYFVLCVFKMTILHVTDLNARFEQTNVYSSKCSKFDEKYGLCFGGFARLKTAFNAYKKAAESQGRNVLIMDAGDIFQGSMYYDLFKPEICSSMLSLLPIDIASLGNHEFDEGPDVLAQFVCNLSITVIASNIDTSKEPNLSKCSNLKTSEIIIVGGVKIGIVGYVLPASKHLSDTGKIIFFDEIPSLLKETKKLKKDGAKLIIALGHSGFDMDKEIAFNVPDIDIIVGGHSNTFLYNGIPPSVEIPEGPYPFVVNNINGKVALIAQLYGYTKYLGVLNIDYDDDFNFINHSGNPVLLNYSISQDPYVLKFFKKYQLRLDEISMTVLGKTKVFLDGSINVRKEESNLANMITDSFVEHYLLKHVTHTHFNEGWTDSPIAVIQAAAIKASINASKTFGHITYRDVLSALPTMEQLSRVIVSGKVLRKIFEMSVALYQYGGGNFEGGFLQVSGVKVVYDVSKMIGERVQSLKVRCGFCLVPRYSDVVDEKNYSFLVNNILVRGEHGYDMIQTESYEIDNLDEVDTDILIAYVKRKSVIHPSVEGRIIITNPASELSAVSFALLYSIILLLSKLC